MPDHLFELIKTLSKSEKRFFKLEASKYSKKDGNDYLKLYKLVEQQEEYDEKQIKRALKGSSLLKRLPSTKNYLYKLLLRSLSQFQHEKNAHFEISNLLQEVDILFSRGLYTAADKLVRKAKKIAIDAQKIATLLQINEWEITLANFEITFEKSQKKIAALQKERETYFKTLREYANMELLYEEVGAVTYSIGKARTPADKQVYLDFFKRKAVLDAEKSTDFGTQILLYAFKDTTSYMMDCPEEEIFSYAQKRIELHQSASLVLNLENAYFYAATVFDYIQSLLAKKEKEEAQKVLAETKTFWKNHKNSLSQYAKSMFFFTISYHSTKIPMLEGDFQKVVDLAQELKPEFELRKNKPSEDPALYIIPLNLGFSCFVLKSYSEALYWFHYILNDSNITIRPDVLGFVRILHLLVQFELENKQILSYYADSTKRFLAKNDKLYEFEQLFLQFIKQLAFKTQWDSEYKSILRKLKDKLLELEKNGSYEQEYIQQYYLIEWLDSKILQRNFLDLILEKLDLRKAEGAS